VGPDVADRDLSGEAVIRLAHDPSPPVLSPVRLQTTPVLSDSKTDDAEQRQEQVHTTPESGTLTNVYRLCSSTVTNFGLPRQPLYLLHVPSHILLLSRATFLTLRKRST